ncbi:hypothetical protein B0H17DRAFT_1123896 [Mycena rosella]|uniref:Ribonuclease H1 N-terminal domain-containing protein n=1 Tax=Mycena rosella TaxID=1033263 RepID=A0AAD7H2P1_MYCRO|nr:hypothetical protein B0H17DRAFT_1123896 [Mycena rosella]
MAQASLQAQGTAALLLIPAALTNAQRISPISSWAHISLDPPAFPFVPNISFHRTPPTPAELAGATPLEEDEATPFWVVLRGRQPGLYRNFTAAQQQTNGVPHNQQNRKVGRTEALTFYAANHPLHVKKWIELPAPVPVAAAASAADPTDPAPSGEALPANTGN